MIWVGWTESAKYLRENGVRLDSNFTAGRFHRGAYLNGSGLPVKLMDEDGELLDIYEQCTTLTDDAYVGVKVLAPALTIDECIAFTQRRLEDAAERFHSVYNPCFHPVRTRPGAESNQRWYEAAIEHCIDRGFHFASAPRLARLQRRQAVAAHHRVCFRPGVPDSAPEPRVGDGRERSGSRPPLHIQGQPHEQRVRGRWRGGGHGSSAARRAGSRRLLPADYEAGSLRHWRIRWSVG